jgi:hypothetical protein
VRAAGIRVAIAAALALSLARCGRDPTAFYVTVTALQSMMPAPNSYARVEVVLTDAATRILIQSRSRGAVTPLPYTFTVESTGAHARVLIEVRCFTNATDMQPVAVGRAAATFVPDAVMRVPVEVSTECRATRSSLMPGMGGMLPMRIACTLGMPGADCGAPLSGCEPTHTCKITPGQPPTCADADAGTLTRYILP